MRRRLDRQGGNGSRRERAILLVGTVSQRRVVMACSESASRAGVAPGMTLAHARALVKGAEPHVEAHDGIADHHAMVRLAMWAHRFSPLVAPDPPDGLMMDVTGCERVFRGERRLLRIAVAGLERLGIRARGAIAPTFGCAWAVARYGEGAGVIVADGKIREAMEPLPIAALRIEDEVAGAMREIGIERVGELMAIDRAGVGARFGRQVLHRLDQAMGEAMEMIEPVRPLLPPTVERIFDGATTRTDAIERATVELIDELVPILEERGSGARVLRLELGRVDSVPVEMDVTLSRPSRDARHLWTLLRPSVERANLGFGVERVTLTAARTGRVHHTQSEHWNEARSVCADGADTAALIDLLSNRLGRGRVMRMRVHESHVPERSFGLSPALDVAGSRRESAPPRHIGWVMTGSRPACLLESPEPAEAIAMAPDAPPSRLRWRGREWAIDAGVGPERIAPEWWRESVGTRDYYRVREAGGTWLWVYRDIATASWFVHGLWS